jgi:peptide methionine sulfoxide reductase MsrB
LIDKKDWNLLGVMGSVQKSPHQAMMFCAACGSHLGHVFKGEGYAVPTDERWCINSVAMVLEAKK